MTESKFLILFFVTQIVLVFAHIYQKSKFLTFSYENQRLEKLYEAKHEEHSTLQCEFEKLKKRETIRLESLRHGMEPVGLKHIRSYKSLAGVSHDS